MYTAVAEHWSSFSYIQIIIRKYEIKYMPVESIIFLILIYTEQLNIFI